MDLIEILFLAAFIGLIESYKEKQFHLKIFIKTFLTFTIGFFIVNILVDRFIPDQMAEEINDQYGIWIFGGFVLIFTITLTLKGFFKKKNLS